MKRRAFTAALIVVIVAGCSDDDPDAATSDAAATSEKATSPTSTQPGEPAQTSAPATDTTAPADQTTVAGSPTVTTVAPPGSTAPSPSPPPSSAPTPEPVVGEPVVALELVAELDTPIGLGVRPGDESLYVIEQAGHVVRVSPSGDTAEVANIDDRTDGAGEQGLLGIAFSPDATTAYLDYTDNDGDTVVAAYPVADDGTFDVEAERVMLTIDQPYPNHNGGDLVTGPDGMLYVAMGDGGSGGDPERRASDPENLLGKLLRIDPTPSADAPYTIPADNPFATGAMADLVGAPEVWSWGLRNPWKIAFDPLTGSLWIADVGQNAIEEVNVVDPTPEHPAGWAADFGWSGFEGDDRYNDDVPDPGNLTFPVWTYGHDTGCSISGGAVYRGTAVAELAPAYVYSDYCSGVLWAFDAASGRNLELLDGLEGVAAVRAGPDGELYVVEQSGAVSRLVQG